MLMGFRRNPDSFFSSWKKTWEKRKYRCPSEGRTTYYFASAIQAIGLNAPIQALLELGL